MAKGKSYEISKQVVWEAYQKVKANRGAAGVDRESLEDFEKDLKGNLYKIWNQMSSGSYFPPPVRLVEIPKDQGRGVRPLGIPTVGDRIAQMVAKMYFEPLVEPHFHPDSYGYRPGKSALDAVGTARERCWHQDWLIDLAGWPRLFSTWGLDDSPPGLVTPPPGPASKPAASPSASVPNTSTTSRSAGWPRLFSTGGLMIHLLAS